MKREHLQLHHNPPKWFAKWCRIPKRFYNDEQHTRWVTPKEHKLINSHYTEQMQQVYGTIPRGTRMVETRVIPKETILFDKDMIK